MLYTKDILDMLPLPIRKAVEELRQPEQLQEIRIKVNKPLILRADQKEIVHAYVARAEDLKFILQRISNYSIYAFEEELRQGYITVKGGHRVGICGHCVVEQRQVKTIKDVASINIRICKEVPGCAAKIMPYILKQGQVLNTIIISPPKCGKTTLLREIAKNLSQGDKEGRSSGKNVTIIDERSEIAACYKGLPQMEVGVRTDVLDHCPKSQGIMMAIRSMSPDVIICDEIGTHQDMESILMALNSGVNVVTSIHGFGIEDLYKRAVFKEIMDNYVFQRAIVLSNRKGIGTIEYVYDFAKGEKIRRGEAC